MRLLVVGATGTLGQAIVHAARERGWDAEGAARSGADHALDVADAQATTALVEARRPELIVNCAAIVDLAACERDPGRAYVVNARACSILAETGVRLVQVSTDHFWTGDGRAAHDEDAPVRLLNEYARTKFAGEELALAAPGALVVRTNLTGLRGLADRPTFAEWAMGALERGEDLRLFDDYVTSTIDAPSLAEALLDLAALGAAGRVNVAAREGASKLEFILALARAMGLPEPTYEVAGVRGLQPPRAESAVLGVGRAEALLGRELPGLEAVVTRLAADYAAAR